VGRALSAAVVEVTRSWLELASPGDLRPALAETAELRLERVQSCPASFFRYLYAEVGRAYRWEDRLDWSDARIRAHVARPEVALFVLSLRGAPAGYFELERHADGSFEIAYFGLLPEFHGRGLGKHLLTEAARQAFDWGATRVWLHTCSLDDRAALPNYLARGFRVLRTETYLRPARPELEAGIIEP
jgi:ribosomal protein S18 acetylase RimI-like enzyme